jgi:hypothetical protein
MSAVNETFRIEGRGEATTLLILVNIQLNEQILVL